MLINLCFANLCIFVFFLVGTLVFYEIIIKPHLKKKLPKYERILRKRGGFVEDGIICYSIICFSRAFDNLGISSNSYDLLDTKQKN